MMELDAIATWATLTLSQRGALLAAMPWRPMGYNYLNAPWPLIDAETQKLLLRLDWNMMLGGKLGRRES